MSNPCPEAASELSSTVLPGIKRLSLLKKKSIDAKQRFDSSSKSQIKVADEGLEIKFLSKQTPYQNLHRAKVYAKNEVLKRLEMESFEKLKADVASGSIALEDLAWSSDDSSVLTSLSGSPKDLKKKHGTPKHSELEKELLAITQSATCAQKDTHVADKHQPKAATSTSRRRPCNGSMDKLSQTPIIKKVQNEKFTQGKQFGGV